MDRTNTRFPKLTAIVLVLGAPVPIGAAHADIAPLSSAAPSADCVRSTVGPASEIREMADAVESIGEKVSPSRLVLNGSGRLVGRYRIKDILAYSERGPEAKRALHSRCKGTASPDPSCAKELWIAASTDGRQTALIEKPSGGRALPSTALLSSFMMRDSRVCESVKTRAEIESSAFEGKLPFCSATREGNGTSYRFVDGSQLSADRRALRNGISMGAATGLFTGFANEYRVKYPVGADPVTAEPKQMRIEQTMSISAFGIPNRFHYSYVLERLDD